MRNINITINIVQTTPKVHTSTIEKQYALLAAESLGYVTKKDQEDENPPSPCPVG
jgi:hypothetical protein